MIPKDILPLDVSSRKGTVCVWDIKKTLCKVNKYGKVGYTGRCK